MRKIYKTQKIRRLTRRMAKQWATPRKKKTININEMKRGNQFISIIQIKEILMNWLIDKMRRAFFAMIVLKVATKILKIFSKISKRGYRWTMTIITMMIIMKIKLRKAISVKIFPNFNKRFKERREKPYCLQKIQKVVASNLQKNSAMPNTGIPLRGINNSIRGRKCHLI